VTVSALIASGQVAQITHHLNRAMDNGLTQQQAGEVVADLALYAGWPNASSALPVVNGVFEERSHSNFRPLPFRGRGRAGGFSNPQPNPQNAMSCTACGYLGSPRVVLSLW
jgi:hypothetical protein